MEIRDSQPINILYADDSPDDRSFFSEAIVEANIGYILLTTVEDGDKLMRHLAKADGQLPDIIFLDINMPRKDGRICLKEIRSDGTFDHVPVIMFSTSAYTKDIEDTFTNGANLYVSKPAFFSDEVEILKKIFESNWKEDLLKSDMARFVLHVSSTH